MSEQMNTVEVSVSQNQSEWIEVVEAIAGFVALGLEEEDIFEGFLRRSLISDGHCADAVDHAIDWLEQAAFKGNLSEVLSMMQTANIGSRIESPLERASFSDAVWLDLWRLRSRGLVGQEVMERLVEGIRSIDARDLEDEDVRALITDVMSKSMPGKSVSDLEKILNGRQRHFYS